MGTPLFFLRVAGIRVGRVLWHPYHRPVPNSRKERLAVSYDPDTRRPHWPAQLINLGMENWFILGMKDPTTVSFILCTSPRNGASSSMVAPQTSLVVPSLEGFPTPEPVLGSHRSFFTEPFPQPFSQIHVTQRFSPALPLFPPRLPSAAALSDHPRLPPGPRRPAREPVGAHLGHPRRWSGHRWLCHLQRGAPGTSERSCWSSKSPCHP